MRFNMLIFLLIHFLMWTSSYQTEFLDLLSSTNKFFEEFKITNAPNLNAETLKLMLERTYNLNEDVHSHVISKRSIDLTDSLIRDKKGVYLLSGIEDFFKVPAKFPNDINVFSNGTSLYIFSLEANGTLPENQLANDLVLYEYSDGQKIKEASRVPVSGGAKVAFHIFQDIMYIMTAEHDSNNSRGSYQGSGLYKLIRKNEKVNLEKIQILNINQPKDIKFWDYQDQLYLAAGASISNDSTNSVTFIYKWMGYHFDCVQIIPGKDVKSIMPFELGASMYLAIANFKDEFGNSNIYSEIFKFHLEDNKFKLFQKIRTHGACDFAYFKFDDKHGKSEHFLVVANSLGKNSEGNLSSLTESVVYKFSKDYFIPFQSFRLHGANQWLPIVGSNDEFLLLVSFSYGILGYQYDGWRFTESSLNFGQSSFGSNIHSIRAFHYQGNIYLTVADKESYGNKVNIWKLFFSKQNDLENHYNEIKVWCDQVSLKLREDDFDEIANRFEKLADAQHQSNIAVEMENLKKGNIRDGIHHDIQNITQEMEELEGILKAAEKNLKNFDNSLENTIVFGSREIPQLETNCSLSNCCVFRNLRVSKLNGLNVSDFLDEIIYLNEDTENTFMKFKHVVATNYLSASLVNDHPSETLLDTTLNNFINAEIIVKGTIFVNGNLKVKDFFDDAAASKKNHILLYNGDQNFEDELLVRNLTVENLKLSGSLNNQSVEQIFHMAGIYSQNNFKELNTNNIFVKDFIKKYITEIISETLKNSRNSHIKGDVDCINLEAPEIFIDSDRNNNMNNNSVATHLNGERFCEEDSNSLSSENFTSNEHSEDYEDTEISEEYIIIVQGFFKVKDIYDLSYSTSLLNNIVNSYRLDDVVINSAFNFSDVKVNHTQVEFINDIPLTTWILKNANETKHLYGRKTISSDFRVTKKVTVHQINDIVMSEWEKDVLKLDEDQIVPGHLKFNTFTTLEIATNGTIFGEKSLEKVKHIELKGSIKGNHLIVKNLILTGKIAGIGWADIANDSSIRAKGSSQESLDKVVNVKNLNIMGRINGLMLEEFMAINSRESNKISLNSDLKLKIPLKVNQLHFEGLLDSSFQPNFQQEWLLCDGEQIITGPIVFENVEMKSGSNLMNDTINNIYLSKLFGKSLKVNKDNKISHLYVIDKLTVEKMELGGYLNGADFNNSVVRSTGKKSTEISGDWLLSQGLMVNGSLTIDGLVSGLNVSHLCEVNVSESKINLIVRGSVKLKQEPKINMNVNKIDSSKLAKMFWMKNENTTLKNNEIEFEEVEFNNDTTLSGFLNDVNLTHVSKFYLSKTLNRVISAELSFNDVVIRKSCVMHGAKVVGPVNGINLTHWSKNVLLHDVDQVFEEKVGFEVFETSDLKLDGTLNRLDLSTEVLRRDVEDAIVEGEKTFYDVVVGNLTIEKSKTLQGINIDDWIKNSVRTNESSIIMGDLTLTDVEFSEMLMALGKVNDIQFDSTHLLTIRGNQVVTGNKNFKNSNHPLKIKYLVTSKLMGGVDVVELLKNQAYSDRDSVFKRINAFSKGLTAESVEMDGSFQEINITQMCEDVFTPVDVNPQRKEFENLLQQTETLINVAKNRAFFFDYFELIQTIKPNVNAMVPVIDYQGNHLLIVTERYSVKYLTWNKYSQVFVDPGRELRFNYNFTFVASEISQNNSLLYIENSKFAKIVHLNNVKEIESADTSCVEFFHLKPLNKSCIFIGQKWNSSRIMCHNSLISDIRTYQWLESKGSVQATVLSIDDEVYIAVINKEGVVDKFENTISIYHFDAKLQHFYIVQTLAEVNPVAVSSVSYKNDHYVVSAGGHLPESVRNSVLSIFRFSKHRRTFVRNQSIVVDTPVDVRFALLPSSQLALYVLTSNPTKPFVMFLHKGISGFIEETSGLSLYPGSILHSFTDSQNQHFALITGFGRGQVLRAGFKGDKRTP